MTKLRDLKSLAQQAARQGMRYKACGERRSGHEYALPIEWKTLGGKPYPGLRCPNCTVWKAFDTVEQAEYYASRSFEERKIR